MKSLFNRKAVTVAVCAGLLLGVAGQAAAQGAQSYPSKPVRVFASSGGSETFARLLTSKMGEVWGQAAVTEVRSGASGLIVLEALSQSPPDGYTLSTVTLGQALSTVEHQRHLLSTDFEPVTFAGSTPFTIAINPSLPVKNLEEWIAYVKARPGKVTYSSSGLWGSAHMCMEEFISRTGTSMLHVPYKNSNAGMASVVSGETQVYCSAAANALKLAQAGKVKLLGSTYKEASDLVPGVPPVADKVPGFEVLGWYGLIAPLKTPKDVINKSSADFVKVLRSKEMTDAYAKLGIRVDGSTPERFAQFLKAETERWNRVAKEQGKK